MHKSYYVYILASARYGYLYVGITSTLLKRMYEHREKLVPGHTKRHNITKLVYYEVYNEPAQAIHREKQLKRYTREFKFNLIEAQNASWADLYDRLVG